ncbi:MAG: C4-dicarboxylate ABC transporter substrate-binding protein, partial [Deltaproteobacteria bacterium]|nr:C4-dicarboxylate ABC transporter substrate-binding protein [Deltaproteobacteria bacterium]
FKLHEILNYFHDTRLYATGFWIVMNKNVWKKLPKDIQEQILSVSGEKAAVQLGSGWDEIGNAAWEFLKGRSGKNIITYPESDRKKWAAYAKPIWDAHVKKLEAKGLPGREALEYTKKLMEEID